MTETASLALARLPLPGLALLRQAFNGAADHVGWLDRLRVARRLRRMMRASLGYEPDLRRPRSFNERIAWKILHDRNPLIPLTLDKVAVRPWVAERIGWRYLVPALGLWDHPGEIRWERLPRRFVLKANHGSGYNAFVADRDTACRTAILATAAGWLAENYGQRTGEWGYRPIRPRLIAEEYLPGTGTGGVPEDYKLYVFGGRPRLLQVHLGRYTDRRRELFYDPLTLAPLDFGRHRHADCPDYPGPPPEAALLHGLAARLGAGFDAVRVDFYLIGGEPRFGELTHYSGGAVVPLGTMEEDFALGAMWAEAQGEGAATPRAALGAAAPG